MSPEGLSDLMNYFLDLTKIFIKKIDSLNLKLHHLPGYTNHLLKNIIFDFTRSRVYFEIFETGIGRRLIIQKQFILSLWKCVDASNDEASSVCNANEISA